MVQNLRYGSGAGSAEPFKVSGKPYLRRGLFSASMAVNSQHMIEFPSITKSITVENERFNTGSFGLRVSFAPVSDVDVSGTLGTGSCIVLYPGDQVTMEVKSRRMFVSAYNSPAANCFYFISAGLSGVVTDYSLTGDGIDEY